MTSRTTARFWSCYRKLPEESAASRVRITFFGVMIQATPRFDSSLSEEVNGPRESACTIALPGVSSAKSAFVWDWIGTDAEYDRLAARG